MPYHAAFFTAFFAIFSRNFPRGQTRGAFGWYDLEQDRTAGAHGAASCQPNATPETEHIFLENVPNFKMCMDHHVTCMCTESDRHTIMFILPSPPVSDNGVNNEL